MTMAITAQEWWAIFTPLLLTALLLGGLLLELGFFRQRPRAVGVFVAGGLLVILAGQWWLHLRRLHMEPAAILPFGGQYYFDVFGVFFNYIFLIAAAATVILSLAHFEGKEDHRGEYYLLVIVAAIGMSMMASAHHFLLLFIGLETMSIAIYILVAGERRSPKSNEAAIKYLLLGAFASAILLYGMALVYGATGQLTYQALNGAVMGLVEGTNLQVECPVLGDAVKAVMPASVNGLLVLLGLALILIGLFFKVAAVPFHMWTPDVYQGAPTPITAFMATGVKAAAFAALVRLSLTVLAPFTGMKGLYFLLFTLAVLTMTLGNFVAIAQRNLKRMLAYSSIAHAGYLLVGVTALIASGQFLCTGGDPALVVYLQKSNTAASSILFYLLAYTFMNLGAFGVIVAVGLGKPGAETLDDFAGLSIRRPGLAAVMAICMLSLAGVPPLAGFAAKFYIFQSAISCRLYTLAVIGVLNSVVSAYFYLRVIVVMYMEPEKEPAGEPAPGITSANLVNALMAAAVVLLGLLPQAVILLLAEAFKPDMINLLIH